jgi:hypothetical protein
MERVFLTIEGVEKFRTQLKDGALGLCDCVCEGVIQALGVKNEIRFMMPPSLYERNTSNPRWWYKQLHECEGQPRCY